MLCHWNPLSRWLAVVRTAVLSRWRRLECIASHGIFHREQLEHRFAEYITQGQQGHCLPTGPWQKWGCCSLAFGALQWLAALCASCCGSAVATSNFRHRNQWENRQQESNFQVREGCSEETHLPRWWDFLVPCPNRHGKTKRRSRCCSDRCSWRGGLARVCLRCRSWSGIEGGYHAGPSDNIYSITIHCPWSRWVSRGEHWLRNLPHFRRAERRSSTGSSQAARSTWSRHSTRARDLGQESQKQTEHVAITLYPSAGRKCRRAIKISYPLCSADFAILGKTAWRPGTSSCCRHWVLHRAFRNQLWRVSLGVSALYGSWRNCKPFGHFFRPGHVWFFQIEECDPQAAACAAQLNDAADRPASPRAHTGSSGATDAHQAGSRSSSRTRQQKGASTHQVCHNEDVDGPSQWHSGANVPNWDQTKHCVDTSTNHPQRHAGSFLTNYAGYWSEQVFFRTVADKIQELVWQSLRQRWIISK